MGSVVHKDLRELRLHLRCAFREIASVLCSVSKGANIKQGRERKIAINPNSSVLAEYYFYWAETK